MSVEPTGWNMSDGQMGLKVYNTLTRAKEDFVPLDAGNVRMYVCGPTVYDFAHIGNARPVIVFDVMFRLLRHLYGEDHVTYVRNITDVDDKINARALRDFGAEIEAGRLSLNDAIRRVTESTASQFHADVAALGCLKPTVEPRATEFVLPRADGKTDMVSLIQTLIDRGHAYAAPAPAGSPSAGSGGEILFDTASMPDYGGLSKRRLEDQQAGARVAVDPHKKNPGDFVLWKGSSAEEPGWEGRFVVDGKPLIIRGRPGWHIECSAMSAAYLGEVFDIHGGGLDLIFPHHENEIAQSRCAHGTPVMANYWMHNGFLQVEGRKMAKSEGNFVTIQDLLATENFGGRRWPGEVLRLAMLMTHYREPIDFSLRKLEEAETILQRWRRSVADLPNLQIQPIANESLLDDLNTPTVIAEITALTSDAMGTIFTRGPAPSAEEVLTNRMSAAERLAGLSAMLGFDVLERQSLTSQQLEAVEKRLAFIREKNFAEADRIREELAGQGIQLKDGKDPVTGERVTTWEVKR